MKFLSHIPSWLKNKYLIAGGAFLVWMLFFAENDLPSGFKKVQTLKELQQTEQRLNNQIVETKSDLDLLKSNPQTIERYARENYLMKKDNEELFIVKPATPESK